VKQKRWWGRAEHEGGHLNVTLIVLAGRQYREHRAVGWNSPREAGLRGAGSQPVVEQASSRHALARTGRLEACSTTGTMPAPRRPAPRRPHVGRRFSPASDPTPPSISSTPTPSAARTTRSPLPSTTAAYRRGAARALVRRAVQSGEIVIGRTARLEELHRMDVIPSLDLLGGRVVHLTHGDFASARFYGEPERVLDALDVPRGTRLHVVDLEGSRSGRPIETGIVRRLALRDLAVQVGGGIRSLDDARRWLDRGVERLVVGTVAAASPALLAELVETFGAATRSSRRSARKRPRSSSPPRTTFGSEPSASWPTSCSTCPPHGRHGDRVGGGGGGVGETGALRVLSDGVEDARTWGRPSRRPESRLPAGRFSRERGGSKPALRPLGRAAHVRRLRLYAGNGPQISVRSISTPSNGSMRTIGSSPYVCSSNQPLLCRRYASSVCAVGSTIHAYSTPSCA
jgi:hypothetical protein